jgi:hypothetical protein
MRFLSGQNGRLAIGAVLGVLATGLFSVATAIPAAASTKWSLAPSPNNGPGANALSAVSCVSARSCQAVGEYYNSGLGAYKTLIESWNGATWSIVPSPNTGTGSNDLNGVSCVSASSCQAVGSYLNGQLVQTLAESWNGATWSIVPSPNNGTGSNGLGGVSCVSASKCQAVGSYRNGSNVAQTLIESWNGATWSIVPSPNIGMHSDNVLSGVVCVSASKCKAVGHIFTQFDVTQTLIESWSGATWSIVPSPNKGTSPSFLLGVSCLSASSCKAVGAYVNGSLGGDQTLIESWDGRFWSIVPSPNTGTTGGNALNVVSCAGTSSCKAVGVYGNTSLGVNRTLIESHG